MNDSVFMSIDDDVVDNHVDEEIQTCVRERKNFFMFAGAGSGKTRSLVNALNFIADLYGEPLGLRQKRVAVITYTNAACDEINRRIGHNSLFAVSTIHSFLWELIKPYQHDIKSWIKEKLQADIDELTQQQNNPRRRKDRSGDIAKKQKRYDALDKVVKFTYNPNGENVGRDSLDHSEVISMGSSFIRDRKMMQNILVSKFPILLIDESQDTKKDLIDALLAVEENHSDDFTIGMFGDTMQRIYADGKENLEKAIPENWERPAKKMNHRSTHRIVQLANAIRNNIDNQQQQPRTDKDFGIVRLFIVPYTTGKDSIEDKIYSEMAEITKDNLWGTPDERKTLVLEHSMAAARLGFGKLENDFKGIGQTFRDGTLVELAFLMKIVAPLLKAKREQNNFAAMKILREHSPLLKREILQAVGDQLQLLGKLSNWIDSLVKLWDDNNVPTCLEIYKLLSRTKLFELPKRIEEVLSAETEVDERILTLREGLNTSFTEVERYWDYINESTQFSTHQGIKGLEFERVAVIMDDESAGGFLFSYDKLFGAKALTKTDIENEREGKDTAILRTTRLFYVTCTRAQESLALIAYTASPDDVRKTVLANGWFTENEVITITA